MRAGVLAVDLVDHDDRLEPVLHRLAEHELRLGLRAVVGIDYQQDAVHHFHDALDLAAEVRVARGIHDVDVVAVPPECRVLGADGDAFFLLQIHGIHHADFGLLVGAECSRLLEELVHERGLSVVNVGDDCDVTNFIHRSAALNAGPDYAGANAACQPAGAFF